MRSLPNDLLAELRRPHGHGAALPTALVAEVENAACGDKLRLAADLEGARISRSGFEARGCSATLSLASRACAAMEGLELDQLAGVGDALRRRYKSRLAPTRHHALDLVERALSQMLAQARERCHPGDAPAQK